MKALPTNIVDKDIDTQIKYMSNPGPGAYDLRESMVTGKLERPTRTKFSHVKSQNNLSQGQVKKETTILRNQAQRERIVNFIVDHSSSSVGPAGYKIRSIFQKSKLDDPPNDNHFGKAERFGAKTQRSTSSRDNFYLNSARILGELENSYKGPSPSLGQLGQLGQMGKEMNPHHLHPPFHCSDARLPPGLAEKNGNPGAGTYFEQEIEKPGNFFLEFNF